MKLNFAQFVQFMLEREKKLELIFNGIDADNDSELFMSHSIYM